jgi:hypothetical protein
MGGAFRAYDSNGKCVIIFLVGKSEAKRLLVELGIDGRIILRWIFWKYSGSIKAGSFLVS